MAINLQSGLLTPAERGSFHATLDGHGSYNTFQFVLRLSPKVHKALGGIANGSQSTQRSNFETVQAFSTFLHETIHWWQHVGSTHGLMLSLTYPTQAHANYTHLKELLERYGFQKSVRELALTLPGPSTVKNVTGLANRIVNNHFDFGAFRALTYNSASAKDISNSPLFESVGHAHQIAYGNNILVLGATVDPEFKVLPHPKGWEDEFHALRAAKETGFYFKSPIELWGVGTREIFEGQACFSQMQYLAFASNGRLELDDFKQMGMLHGVYESAFNLFLEATQLDRPASVTHPTVGLFLLVCDMAINPGAGFPFEIWPHFRSFITDTDPGARFMMLATLIRIQCPWTTTAIRHYSREEYVAVTSELARYSLNASPLEIAAACTDWIREDAALHGLMGELETFDFKVGNTPVRVLFSHFLAFMQDKLATPEFFCWPGAWMAGERVSEHALFLFDRHGALFIDKEDDDGIFPRLVSGRSEESVQNVFDSFYAANVTYDMTDQWIQKPGRFNYNYRWLSQNGTREEMKTFADRHFEMIYGAHPDDASILSM
ncbi:hypothetical protein ATN84_18490 [Paramesorhizobium deserti]|uniref:Uncharacterized protein n=1 Tax=Paramesorhizobium deserti TaxID=1494590 RepID=A0A135HPY2_9HYPH|nr:hypothetical protein [Paramesorhizobium deserti]KXF75264.1 hypothetical protein ATN84_18490 [Paramesorhizobium deserti]